MIETSYTPWRSEGIYQIRQSRRLIYPKQISVATNYIQLLFPDQLILAEIFT